MNVAQMPERDNTRAQVADEVRAWIARRRLSANKLAPMVGMTQSALSRRLTGVQPFDVDELDAIARQLGVQPVVFFQPQASGRGTNSGWSKTPRQADAKVLPFHKRPKLGVAA